MKILPYVNLYQKTNYNLKTNNYSPLKPLLRDTVSFGYLYERPDSNMQLYRSIGKEEFEKLISGEEVTRRSGYLTSDPRGWHARDWYSGFSFQNEDETYFVTFKPGKLAKRFMSAKDTSTDTRYQLHTGYSIDDVLNIRKGINAHGEIVYSENLERDKKIDQEIKKQEIARIKNLLVSTDNFEIKNEAWTELKGYVREFPYIIDDVKDIVDFHDQADVVGYADLISKVGRESDKSEYGKCLKAYVEGLTPSVDFSYLVKYAEDKDISSIMVLLDREHIYPEDVARVLNRLCDEQTVIKDFLKPDFKKLHVLTLYLSNKNKDGAYTDIYRQVLRIAQTIKADIYDYNYEKTVINSVNQLAVHGDINDISLIKNFCTEDKSCFISYTVAKDTIKQIRSNTLQKN